tara:strand:+ start:1490 stop:2209 length:720 start_codon:yes stop_codon:yes gene_type:complete
MALPKINETLRFNMTIPSTGQRIKYRPYLVKEEKLLLQAFESKDMQMCLSVMSDTLGACLDEKANVVVEKLATFDIEYMFTQIRAKSVGETSDIIISCAFAECGEPNEYVVDLESLNVSTPKGTNVVVITPDISVEMKYPTYETMIIEGASEKENKSESAMELLAGCISAVLTQEERIDTKTESKEDMEEFVGNMTAHQLKGMTDFLENMPALKHDVKFDCKKCGKENSVVLKGLSDFF